MAVRRMQSKAGPEWPGAREEGAATAGDVFRFHEDKGATGRLPGGTNASLNPWLDGQVVVDGGASDVKVVQVGNGDYWIVWMDSSDANAGSPPGFDILGRRYNALGVPQGFPVLLNSTSVNGNESAPEVAQEIGGPGFLLTYKAGSTVYIERKNADGSPAGNALTIAGEANTDPIMAIASATHGLIVHGTTGQFFNPGTMQTIGGTFAVPNAFGAFDVLTNGNYLLEGKILSQAGVQVGASFPAGQFQAALAGGGFVVAQSFGTVVGGQFDSTVVLRTYSAAGAPIASFTIDPQVPGEYAVATGLIPTVDGGFFVRFEQSPTADNYYQFTGDLTLVAALQGATNGTMASLGDGRIVLAEAVTGTVLSYILDPRAGVNAPVYSPGSRQIGTAGTDVFTTDAGGVAFANGHDGNDTITEGLGVDGLISGDNGNDRIILTAADGLEATAAGGSGTDTLVLTGLSAQTFVLLSSQIFFGNQSSAISGFENFETSASVAINISGTGGANLIITGSGNDELDGAGGADILAGGAGNDLYYVDQQGDLIAEAAGGGNDRVVTISNYRLSTNSEVETLEALAGSAAYRLDGNGMANTIIGNEFGNLLDGFGGGDVMRGGGGNDTYIVNHASDVVDELAGQGFDAAYTFVSFALGANTELEWFSTLDNSLTIAMNLTGSSIGQYLIGNQGANILDGRGGADFMQGLGGNDIYYVDQAGDAPVEAAGGGTDTVYTEVSFGLANSTEIEILSAISTSATTAINLLGNQIANQLIGNNGANALDGAGGADVMTGHGGNDTYYVDNAGDQAIEAVGGGFDAVYTTVSFTLAADSEIEWLAVAGAGGTGAINLTGNAFNNYVLGNNGANTINGGAGSDILYGYGGADNFRFTAALGATNVDTITDFAAGTDKIQLANAIFQVGAFGQLPAAAFVTGAQAGDANDRIIYNNATGQLFYDADGSGAGAQILFAILQGNPALTASDFQVI